jgi:hypothetical protein
MHRSSPILPEQAIITRSEHVGCGFRKGHVRGIGNAKSAGLQRFRPFSDGTEITRGGNAIPVHEDSDFCPLTCLFNGCDFLEVHRRDDHCIPAILDVLQDQIQWVGLKTHPHEMLVIVLVFGLEAISAKVTRSSSCTSKPKLG